MSKNCVKKKKNSNLESELYLLIAKFLSTGPCKGSAELLREEIEQHDLLPKRYDWLGNEHSRSFNELEQMLPQIADDHLLKICAQVGPILDKEIPPTVPGLTSLLGVGRQSILRTKEDLQKPKCQMSNLIARKNGMPLLPSHAVQSTYPPNVAQVLISREFSGAVSSRHTFTPKIYARQQIYRRLLGHLSSVYCVLFDRTGKYIFTGADDLLVKIWSALDGRLLAALRGHSAEITDMAVNHENTLLAAGSCDKTIRVWCLRTTAPVAVLYGHTGMVTSLQFCPYPKNEDRLLISTGNDGCVCFWHWNPNTNVFNPKPLKFTERNKANAQMICSSFSSGGLFLATGSTDYNVRVYNITGWSGPEKILEREAHTDRVDSLQFSNRDCRFISGSKDGTALIWKYEQQNWTSIQLKMSTKPGQSEEPEDTKTKLRVTMVGWTLDDDKVITAVSDHSIKVWNSYNGNLCYILKGHEDEVFVLEPHPTDSRVFLSSGHDGRIIIWDLVNGTIIKNHFNLIEGQGHGAVFDCKFSPDGLMFASTDSHGHLSIFGFGSVERYKKVPEEQFFHTDYRPLIRDIHHHVLDEQTQTAPHLLPPPFLVDIDGNPYPPNFQRLVPGREHHNDSQLVPYVAVSAEGDAEILEPVRPANDALSDRPTIDDMIERLQQERNQSTDQRDSNEGSSSQRLSTDSARSPRSSHQSVNGNGDRSAAEPFSPRTPRSQAGHSRVGLRRTGESEGVQTVGNWQSRGSHADVPSWVKRVVVKPMKSSLFSSLYQKRLCLADNEINFFNMEKKRRAVHDRSEELRNEEESSSRFQKRAGARPGLRSTAQGDTVNAAFGEDFENPDNVNSHSSSDTETEQQEEQMSDSSEESSGSGDYSDWAENTRSKRNTAKPEPQPSTSHSSRRPASLRRQIKPRRRLVSSDDESEEEDKEDESPSTSAKGQKKPKGKPSQSPKKTAVNGKKLPERFRPPEWLTDVMPHKAPYVPQIGDEILYFRQGHELYVQAVKRNRIYDIYMRNQPWRQINLRDQEVARIDDITFENHPPRLCCLQLTLLNPASKYEETFIVKYHDMADVIDFIVLKQNYDQAMHYDWKPGDRFRSAIDKAWWLGTIKSQKPLNPNFPDSMFQCFLVKWDNGEKEHMSPWDFEPIDNDRLPDAEGGSVDIMPEERLAMMYVPELHEWSDCGRDHDCDRISRGLNRITELSIAESFVTPVDLNLYPSYAIVVEYPMDLGTIKSRVQNRFYRRLEAVKFDVRYIALNAQKFNEPTSRIVKQAKCVVDLCIRFIDLHHCTDPMVLYNEMMEAKQSRSQDSQSELDVLCSEMDSDDEHPTSTRMKRKKQNALHQSSKRVRLENQKYTSKSWKQQCSALLDTFFQCDDSTPFRYPVNLNDYPDYRNIIDIPMDLSTVREKLSNNHYSSPSDFCKDMRLIFQNSRNYNINKKSRIYSMTIRLSAMFEEHIRSVVGDWKSAVKYEEKIRNNQYVSNRRKPLPIQEAGVNVGASTSRSLSLNLTSTSRAESSRLPASRTLNAFSESSSSRSHFSRLSNGTGSKKKVKHEESQSSKGSSVRFKKKMLKPSMGTSMANGVKKRIIQVSKRKIPDKPQRKHSERTKKKESFDEEFSQSDSNTSNHSNYSTDNSRSNDAGWNRKAKRLKKDSPPNFKKALRPREQKGSKSLRSTRSSSSYHQKSSIYSASPRTHARSSHSRPRARSRSSSPETPVYRAQRTIRNKLSPPVRSKRPVRKPVTRYSEEEGSESGNASESQSLKSERNSNSSGGSSKSSSNKSRSQITESSSKSQQYFSSSESENTDTDEVRPRRAARFAAKAVTKCALTGLADSSKKSGRIQTRNRGQRTVQYQEGDSEDSENAASMQSSRGSLRSQTNGDEQNLRIRKGAAEKTAEHEEGLAGKASSSEINKRSDLVYDASAYSEHSYSIRSQRTNSSYCVPPLHRKPDLEGHYDRHTNHRQNRHSGVLSHSRSTAGKSKLSDSKNCAKNSNRKREFKRDYHSDASDKSVGTESKRNQPKSNQFRNTSNYSLRKCSKLIKRSVYKRPPYLMYNRNKKFGNSLQKRPGSSLFRTRDRVIKSVDLRSKNMERTLKKTSLRNYSPISLNTRSKLHLETTHEGTSTKRTSHKPTIVFCKASTSVACESDIKNEIKTNEDSSKDKVKSTANSTKTEDSKYSKSGPISSNTRSSSPKSLEQNMVEGKKNGLKKLSPQSVPRRLQLPSTRSENSKSEPPRGFRLKPNSSESVGSQKKMSPNFTNNDKDGSSILESNKSKWCLRKPQPTLGTSRNPHSDETDANKVQTRNRGQRTVIYDEDKDNNYLTEILENEDPVKPSLKQISHQPSNSKETTNDSKEKCTPNCDKTAGNSKHSIPASITRPKKEALKILSNGIETRNHGQRTTVYAEDGDDYLEEYFESLEMGL